MSVFIVFKNDIDGFQRFFGIFSDYDKAIDLCKSCVGNFQQFDIRKVAIDKIY